MEPPSFTNDILAFDRKQGLALTDGAVDAENGTIKGVSLATANVEAVGHGEYDKKTGELKREFWTDEETLQDMLRACLAIGQPLKAKMEHGTGLAEIVGEFDNFRIEGDHLRADFTAYPSSKHVDHLFMLAKRLFRQFGVSLTSILRKIPVGTVDVMRCEEILSADFVDEPAINAALFSRKNKPTKPTILMDENAIKEMLEAGIKSALEPLTSRLAALEEGNKPAEEALQGVREENAELQKKLDDQASELAAQKVQITELSKTAEDAKALGVKFGAQLSAQENKPEGEALDFEAELSRIEKENGVPRHIAFGQLQESKPEIIALEAKKQGKQIWQLL